MKPIKFYIASSFQNIANVRYMSEKLTSQGFIHTYDWTKNERPASLEQLQQIGQEEMNAVSEADIVIIIFPAGKGSHIELGIALGQKKTIYLYSPDNAINHFDTTSTFYHLSQVQQFIGSKEEFVNHIQRENTL